MPAKTLTLDSFLPYRLAVTAAAVSRGLSSVYAERFGITVAEWRILANLGQHGALTAGEVAARSTLDKSKVTRALQRLKTRRLLTRTVSRDDRRQATIALTAAGERLFIEIAALARTWEAELLAGLPTDERKALDRSLARLMQRAADLAAG